MILGKLCRDQGLSLPPLFICFIYTLPRLTIFPWKKSQIRHAEFYLSLPLGGYGQIHSYPYPNLNNYCSLLILPDHTHIPWTINFLLNMYAYPIQLSPHSTLLISDA
jgi:hypothetical protein